MIDQETIEFLSTLVPAPDWGFGTGALPLLPDARDYPMERLPSVADMLQQGFPAAYDLSGLVEQVYNQGSLPSCFPAGTLIRMADGSERPIEDLRLLDQAVTAEGHTGTVTALMVREHAGPMLRLKLWGHRHLRMTPEHPVMTRQGYVRAAELKNGDWIALTRFAPETIQTIRTAHYAVAAELKDAQREGKRRYANRHGEDIDVMVAPLPEEIRLDEDFGRLIGLFLAEGTTSKSGAQWTFSLKEAKTLAQETINLLRDRLGVDAHVQMRPQNNVVKVTVYGKHWRLLFSQLCAHGSWGKRLHPDLCSGPREFLAGVFEGWMDGDGYLSPRGRRVGVTVSHQLAMGMFDIAQALGLRPSISVAQASSNRHAQTRRMPWTVETFSGSGRDTYRSEQTDTHVFRKVITVEEERPERPLYVYNFEVEGDNSYVAEGIAVHNCVAHSTCGMKSIEDKIDRKIWNVYDAVALYRENGGNGSNGVDTRGVLQDAQANGVPLLSGGGRNRIGSYAFAPQIEGQFEATLKAAVAANEPCVLAVLLPTQFGWDSGGAITQAYHQLCLCGYDDTWAIFLNSWGSSFGRNGLCRLPWFYITQNNFQQRYAYAYTAVDALVAPPPPPPGLITVTGYGRTTVTPSVSAGASFSILGSGFDQVGNLAVSWGGQSLPITQRTQNVLVTTAPTTPGVAPVVVSLGGQVVTGPMLPVLPPAGPLPPPPPPPGDLVVLLSVRSYSDGTAGIWATVKDAAGAFVAATCSGTAGGQELPARAAQSNGIPAVWMIQAAAGALITLNAVAADGRTGSGTATV